MKSPMVNMPNVDADMNTDYRYLIGKKINECLHNVKQHDYFVQSTLKYFHYHIHRLKLDRQALFRVYNCVKGVLRYLKKWSDQDYKLDIAVLLDVSCFEVSSNYSAIKLLVDQMLNPNQGDSITVRITENSNINYLLGLMTQHCYVNRTWDIEFAHLNDQRQLTMNIPVVYTLLTDKWIKFRIICQKSFIKTVHDVNNDVLLMPKHYLNTVAMILGIDVGPRISSFELPEAIPTDLYISRWMSDMIGKINTYGCDIMFLAHQFKDSYVPEVDIQFCYLTLYQLSYYETSFRIFHFDWESNDYPFVSGLMCSHEELMLGMDFVVQLNKSYEVIDHLLPEPDYFQIQRYDPIFEALTPLFIYLPDEDIMRHGRDLFLYRAVKAHIWKLSNKLTLTRYIQSGLFYDYHHILREYGPIVLRKMMKNNNYIVACPYYNLFKEAKWSEISSLIFEQQCHNVSARSELLEWLYIFTVLENNPSLNTDVEYGMLLDSIVFERCSPMTILFRYQLIKIMGGDCRSSIYQLTKVSRVDVIRKIKNRNVFTCMVKPRKVKYDFDTDLLKTKKDKFSILPLFDLEVSSESMFKLIDMYIDTDLFVPMTHAIKIIWSQHVFKEYLSKISKIKPSSPDTNVNELKRYNQFVDDYVDKPANKKNLRKNILRMLESIDRLLRADHKTIKDVAIMSQYEIIRAKLNRKLYFMDQAILSRHGIETTLNNANTEDLQRTIDSVKNNLDNQPSIEQCKDYITLLLRSYEEFLSDPVILEYKKFIEKLDTDKRYMRQQLLFTFLLSYEKQVQLLQEQCEKRITKLMNRKSEKILEKLNSISTAEQLKRFIIQNYAFIVDHPDVEIMVNNMLSEYDVIE
jgi:hypothetical protein